MIKTSYVKFILFLMDKALHIDSEAFKRAIKAGGVSQPAALAAARAAPPTGGRQGGCGGQDMASVNADSTSGSFRTPPAKLQFPEPDRRAAV